MNTYGWGIKYGMYFIHKFVTPGITMCGHETDGYGVFVKIKRADLVFHRVCSLCQDGECWQRDPVTGKKATAEERRYG